MNKAIPLGLAVLALGFGSATALANQHNPATAAAVSGTTVIAAAVDLANQTGDQGQKGEEGQANQTGDQGQKGEEGQANQSGDQGEK